MCFELIPAQGSKQGLSFKLPGFTVDLKLMTAIVELFGATTASGKQLQRERRGYFAADRVDHVTGTKPVFDLAVGLKDS